jgi:hypothetical protein
MTPAFIGHNFAVEQSGADGQHRRSPNGRAVTIAQGGSAFEQVGNDDPVVTRLQKILAEIQRECPISNHCCRARTNRGSTAVDREPGNSSATFSMANA